MDSFNTGKAEKRLEKAKQIEEEYYKRMSKLINSPSNLSNDPSTSTTKITHNHAEGCATCGREGGKTPRKRRIGVTPHANTGEKDPHYDYTKRELAKHLALIQNHFTDYKCPNCIAKHLMIIEGLAEEGIPMTSDTEEKTRFQRVIEWARKADKRGDYDKLLDECREVRLMLTGSEHGEADLLITSEHEVKGGSHGHEHGDGDHDADSEEV